MNTIHPFKLLKFTPFLMLFGCASVVSGRFQDVHVTTYCASQRVEAACQISNENGEWSLTTPGRVTVQKGFGDLVLFCRGDNFEPHMMRIQSSANASTYGNILLGAGAGALIDVNDGAGFGYPNEVNFVVKNCQTPKPANTYRSPF
jgi:hypothetical protein